MNECISLLLSAILCNFPFYFYFNCVTNLVLYLVPLFYFPRFVFFCFHFFVFPPFQGKLLAKATLRSCVTRFLWDECLCLIPLTDWLIT
ncbi:hypothetical protein ES332_A10G152000v1 [Gossypium tomentosum]|uniref:Uncharacterized protein n=1 Tax=Gossypium tomentosum TaxID=34277 RepID=A0A5D2NQ70_GOSTO|nr:hypothetical protein ES332_A10G152000v1 [Gossypium tomentosum]